MSYNKFVYILTIYLNKLELGLDLYVYMYVFTSLRLVHCGTRGSFLLRYPYFIFTYANTLYSVLFFFRSWRECYIQVLYI